MWSNYRTSEVIVDFLGVDVHFVIVIIVAALFLVAVIVVVIQLIIYH